MREHAKFRVALTPLLQHGDPDAAACSSMTRANTLLTETALTSANKGLLQERGPIHGQGGHRAE